VWYWGASLIAVAVSTLGCAAFLNGVSDKVTATSPTAGARIYVDGFDATAAPVQVPNDRPHLLLVRAPGYRDKVVTLEPRVRPVPIVLDILLAVPTLLVAPLVDLELGWWSGIDRPSQPIALEAETQDPARPRPSYDVGGEIGQAPLPAASESSVPPPPAPAPSPMAPAAGHADGAVVSASAPIAKAVVVSAPSKAPSARAPVAAPMTSGLPPAPPPPKVDCNPNYYFDAQGHKLFKHECFTK
jgi:hypothetical protein